ncbi:MAG: hypothetical protein MK096_13865 [Oleiphilaceae bacterium]|nr:hypothetical protein [Oleiphilaceae bacterium]
MFEPTREQQIVDKYGFLLGLDEIREVLKFKSIDALKKSYYDNKLEVKLQKIEGRSGLFCTAKTVAHYLDLLDKRVEERDMKK